MRLLQRRALPVVALLAAAGSAAPAAARISADPVALLRLPALHAPTAVVRTCSARELPAAAAGALVRRIVVPATGWLDARLTGSTHGPDWDLAVFDAASGRQVGASDGFGSTELVQAPVTAGQVLEVQACRYGGGT